MTTALDSSGARAGPAKRWCACSTPPSTIPIPYSGTCGANTTSIRVATVRPEPRRSVRVAQEQPGQRSGDSGEQQRHGRQHEQRPREQRRRRPGRPRAAPPRASAAATAGTTAPASAPPATTSNSTFGSWFAAA